MTKKITSEDCEGNIEDIEDGRYNSHVVPVSAEDDPGYEEIDYGDCTEFTVPLGRYGSHVVPIGGAGGGGGGSACPNGGLKGGTTVDGKDCLSLNLKPGGAIILQGGQLAIDTTKLKITTNQVFPSGTDTGIVISGPDGESWATQYDYNQWLYEEQKRQDEDLENLDLSDYVTQTEFLHDQQRQDLAFIVAQDKQDEQWAADQQRQDNAIQQNKEDINKSVDPDDNSVTYRFVTHDELDVSQSEQNDALAEDQQRQDEEIEKRVLKAGDTMTGDLIVEADVHANRVETLIVDSGESSNLNLKYDGNTKVYVGRNEVTVQPPLQLNTEGVDANHAVTKGYIDALDAKQAAEISTIEYKLDALLGLTFQGTYEFKHDQTCEEEYQECMENAGSASDEQMCMRNLGLCEQNNVDPGYFEAIDPGGQFDNLQEIIISKSDKSNVEVDWASVLDAGDYLEVDHVFQGQLDKTNYGLYRITEEPETKTNSKGEVIYVMKLQFLQGDGLLNQNELYEIRGITAAEGVNPEELGDFLTKTDAAALYAPKSHSHSGYASSSHEHSGSDITSGTISISRLPTGTTSTTVSKGDHSHSYASSSHAHGNKYVKTGDTDANAHEVRIWKSGSLFYIK